MAGIPGLIADQDFTPISTPSEAEKLENFTNYTDKTLLAMAENPRDPKSQVYALSVLNSRQKEDQKMGKPPTTTVKDDVTQGVQEALPTQYARAGGLMNLGYNVGNYAGGGIVAFAGDRGSYITPDVFDPEYRPFTGKSVGKPGFDYNIRNTDKALGELKLQLAELQNQPDSLEKFEMEKQIQAQMKTLQDYKNAPKTGGGYTPGDPIDKSPTTLEAIEKQQEKDKKAAEKDEKLFEAANLEDAPYKPSEAGEERLNTIDVNKNPYDPFPQNIEEVYGMPRGESIEDFAEEDRRLKEQFGLSDDFFDKRREREAKLEEAAKANTSFDRNLRLAQMGARMAASKSPFFAQAVGEAGTATISDLMMDEKERRKNEQLMKQRKDAIDMAERAEARGDVKAFREKSKEIRGIQKDLLIQNSKNLADFYTRKNKLSKDQADLMDKAFTQAREVMKTQYKGEGNLLTLFETDPNRYQQELTGIAKKIYGDYTKGQFSAGVITPKGQYGADGEVKSGSANSLADELGL